MRKVNVKVNVPDKLTLEKLHIICSSYSRISRCRLGLSKFKLVNTQLDAASITGGTKLTASIVTGGY